ncbi:MAG: DUF1194 domain-containing protein [Alphaproteobacteria bacterium]|nr:DUF1194 domain-containing protein [Alphaproteobacteria bacterium]
MSSLSPYALAIFLAACLVSPAHAQLPQPVELELVLAVDASGSVDRQEFELQIVGLAEAFRDPEIISAIENFADRGIVVTEIQWAAPSNQIVAVEWTLLRNGSDAIAFADRIEEVGRIMHGETAIRQAMSFSRMLIETNGYLGLRHVVDISGDGPTNYGTPPDSTRDELVERGITINGLVIANEFPNLEDYYRDHVIGGFGSFVIAASDYEDFARAIKIKLLREILGAPITQAPQAEPGAPQLARVGH